MESNASSLSGKSFVITGAFGQLGRAVTGHLLALGARAALLDVVQGQAPEGAHAWKVDLSSLADTGRVMAEAADRLGRLDGLVNIAGGFRWQTVEDSADVAEFGQMFTLNLQVGSPGTELEFAL